MGEDLTGLLARLDALEAERDITDTIDRYSHAIDYGLVDEWLDCFTVDGVIEVRAAAVRAEGSTPGPTPQSHVGRHAGRQELTAFIQAQGRPPAHLHKHVVSQSRIRLEGDTATAVSYLVRIDEADGVLRPYSMGRYLDRFVRSPDGRWRIAARVVELEAVTPSMYDAPAVRGDG